MEKELPKIDLPEPWLIGTDISKEQIQPGNGVKYTATVTAGKRIKTGTATFRLAVTDTRGQMYDHSPTVFHQESIPPHNVSSVPSNAGSPATQTDNSGQKTHNCRLL